jgi:methionine-rich copper-binding protein CopC
LEQAKVAETAAQRLTSRAAIAAIAAYVLMLHTMRAGAVWLRRARCQQLILKFSEGLGIKFTTVKVTGPNGKAAATGAPSLDPNDNTSLIIPVNGRLAAGKYKVDWHAVSTNTHKTQGSYSFTVKP